MRWNKIHDLFKIINEFAEVKIKVNFVKSPISKRKFSLLK